MKRGPLHLAFALSVLFLAARCAPSTVALTPLPIDAAPAAPTFTANTGAVLPPETGISVTNSITLPLITTGAVYYVSRAGNNGDGRSWATAWNELDQIDWSVVQAGSTILLDGGGTECSSPFGITGAVNTPPDPDCGMIYETTLNIARSGAPITGITIKLSGEPGRDGTVRIFGGRSNLLPYCGQSGYTYQTSGVRSTGIYIDEGASNIVVDGSKWRGIVIYGHNSRGIRLHKETCVDDAPVPSDITIRYVEIFDNGSAHQSGGLWYPDGPGVDLAGANVVFDRVIIHDNGQDEFQSAGGIRGVTVERSWLYNSRAHPSIPGSAWNGTCLHSDAIQVYGGGDQYGLTVQDSILGPGFREALQLGDASGRCQTAMVQDVTISNTLMVGHHGKENQSGLNTSTTFVTPPSHYVLDHVTSVRDVGRDTWNSRVEGSRHSVTNSVFVGGVLLWVDGGPVTGNNYWWQLEEMNSIGTKANPMFADADFAGVGNGFADFDFTITNPAIPPGTGASITSVARLLDVTPPTGSTQTQLPPGAAQANTP